MVLTGLVLLTGPLPPYYTRDAFDAGSNAVAMYGTIVANTSARLSNGINCLLTVRGITYAIWDFATI